VKTNSKDMAMAMGVSDMKPILHLSDKELKSINSYKIDQEVTLEIKAKVSSINKSQFNQGKLSAEFTIESVEDETATEAGEDAKDTTEGE